MIVNHKAVPERHIPPSPGLPDRTQPSLISDYWYGTHGIPDTADKELGIFGYEGSGLLGHTGHRYYLRVVGWSHLAPTNPFKKSGIIERLGHT